MAVNRMTPRTRNREQKIIVRMMNQKFHSWSDFMVATPRNMKIIVSEELDTIFSAYFIVVCDLCEMFAST